jgi:hypothetical protein
MREIPVDSVSGVGPQFQTVDLSAFQDPAHGFLPDMPIVQIKITGPFDNTAPVAMAGSAAAPTLSGSHTVLSAIAGVVPPCSGPVYMSLAVMFGIRGYYTTGDPAFGLATGAIGSGFWCSEYTPDPTNGKYSATFDLYPGSTLPTWINAIPS